MTENNKVEDVVTEQAAVAPPSIGLADLQNAVKIIDYAAEQGAFKGWTVIEQVIAVRNKLNAFVAYSTPKEEPKVEAEPAKKVVKTVKKVR
jgi:hypothetical protein